jgi:hypothetical protein
MLSSKFLDIVTAVSLFAAVTKLGEIVLDSKQQLWIQRRVDDLCLALIDMNIINWYPRLRQIRLNVPVFIVGLIIFQLLAVTAMPRWSIFQRSISINVMLLVLEFVIYWVWILIVASAETSNEFLRRSLVPGLIAYALFVGIYSDYPYSLFSILAPRLTTLDQLPVLILFLGYVVVCTLLLVLPCLFAFMVCAVVVASLASVFFVAFLAISILRGVVWRISTYAKGAWAGLLFVLTGILGIAEIIVSKL